MQDVWLEKFKKIAIPKIKENYAPQEIIIFGSRIKQTQNEDSDIDVIIIAEYFHNIPFIKRAAHILKVLRFNKHIDILCYAPEEFEKIKNSSSLLLDALSYGERIN